jgi:ribosomal protein S18 acetylase RimI-like enzyme
MVPTAGASDVVVRPGTTADAPTAARLHTEQLDEGMLSSLGPRFLRYLYRRLTLTPGCFLLIAERDRRAVGFIAATENTGAFYKQFLLRDGLVAGVTSAPRIIRALPRVLETLRHGSRPRTASTPAELLSAGVDRNIRGGGIGRVLFSTALKELSSRGAPRVQLVVAKDNAGAVGLYKSLGFWVEEEFEMHPGRMSLLMQWSSFPEENDGGTRSADGA